MKVIALCGKKAIGKTETITALVDILEPLSNHEWKSRQNKRTEDFSILLGYQKKLLAITSYGDAPSLIMDKYKQLMSHVSAVKHEYNEVIFICASHCSQASMDVLIQIANENGTAPLCMPHILLKADTKPSERTKAIQDKITEMRNSI